MCSWIIIKLENGKNLVFIFFLFGKACETIVRNEKKNLLDYFITSLYCITVGNVIRFTLSKEKKRIAAFVRQVRITANNSSLFIVDSSTC